MLVIAAYAVYQALSLSLFLSLSLADGVVLRKSEVDEVVTLCGGMRTTDEVRSILHRCGSVEAALPTLLNEYTSDAPQHVAHPGNRYTRAIEL